MWIERMDASGHDWQYEVIHWINSKFLKPLFSCLAFSLTTQLFCICSKWFIAKLLYIWKYEHSYRLRNDGAQFQVVLMVIIIRRLNWVRLLIAKKTAQILRTNEKFLLQKIVCFKSKPIILPILLIYKSDSVSLSLSVRLKLRNGWTDLNEIFTYLC